MPVLAFVVQEIPAAIRPEDAAFVLGEDFLARAVERVDDVMIGVVRIEADQLAVGLIDRAMGPAAVLVRLDIGQAIVGELAEAFVGEVIDGAIAWIGVAI